MMFEMCCGGELVFGTKVRTVGARKAVYRMKHDDRIVVPADFDENKALCCSPVCGKRATSLMDSGDGCAVAAPLLGARSFRLTYIHCKV